MDPNRILENAHAYVAKALELIELGMPEEAVWLLVNAAGLLGELYPDEMGVSVPTQFGFQILHRKNKTLKRITKGKH